MHRLIFLILILSRNNQLRNTIMSTNYTTTMDIHNHTHHKIHTHILTNISKGAMRQLVTIQYRNLNTMLLSFIVLSPQLPYPYLYVYLLTIPTTIQTIDYDLHQINNLITVVIRFVRTSNWYTNVISLFFR